MSDTSQTRVLNDSQFGPSDGDFYNNSSDLYNDGQNTPYSPKDKYKKYKPMFFLLLIAIFALIGISALLISDSSTNKPFLTILQMNDVYELGTVAGLGGFPKLASFHRQLSKSEPALLTVLAGDFFSPSALGVAMVKVNETEPEKPLHGRQIVDALNNLSPNLTPDSLLVCFGNHEYDISEDSFYSRIEESKFTYISTNVQPANHHTWPPHVVPYYFKKIGDRTLAFVSLSIFVDSHLPYIQQFTFTQSVQMIKDTIQSFKEQKLKYDILVGITHQSLADDSALALEIPELDIIMGGHEHENWRINRSVNPKHPIFINKADSNAKTVFVHRFIWHAEKLKGAPNATAYGTAAQVEGLLEIQSQLVPMDHNIAEDAKMAKVTDYWTQLGYRAFADKGLDPGLVMCHLTEFINAMDKVTRGTVSKIGMILTDSFKAIALKNYKIPADETHHQSLISIVNIGSVRIDDFLLVGDLYQYDALRILPFGGDIVVLELKGADLKQMLEKATHLIGTGMWMGYNTNDITCLQSPDAPKSGCDWVIGKDKVAIRDDLFYSIVSSSYVAYTGWNEWFPSQDVFEVKAVYTGLEDQQHALISYFGEIYPITTPKHSLQ